MIFSGLETGLVFHTHFYRRKIVKKYLTFVSRIGTISDPQTVDKTAEEIKASKQRSYATVSDTQKSLQHALEDLIYSMDALATLYQLAPAGKFDITFDFDDSIIVDKDTEKQLCWQYVIAGKFPAWRYFVKYEGMSEEDAKAAVAEAQAGTPKLFPPEE